MRQNKEGKLVHEGSMNLVNVGGMEDKRSPKQLSLLSSSVVGTRVDQTALVLAELSGLLDAAMVVLEEKTISARERFHMAVAL